MIMIDLWIKEVISGNRKFSEVPDKLKDQVKAKLIEIGKEYLIKN